MRYLVILTVPRVQPLAAADIFVAAAAALTRFGRLRPDFGVGLHQDHGYNASNGAFGLRSYYAPWILADFSLWAETGISKVAS